MRHFKLLLLFISILLVGVSYGQTSDVTDGCFPLTVQFTAPGASSTFFWDFGDGATATIANPSNTFINSGTYNVIFKETVGGPTIGTITINVYDKPVPYFTSNDNQGCAPLTATFTDSTILSNGIVITGYTWVFGDGGTATSSPVTYNFTTEGGYSVALELTCNFPSCNVTKVYNNFVALTNPPLTSFTTNPSPAQSCTAPLTVDFTNTSTGSGAPLTYAWDFGISVTSTAVNPPSQTYTEDGTYAVVLTATDTNGCEASSQINIDIGAPTASFQVADTLCLGDPETMINLSPSSTFSWNFGSDATPTSSPATNPNVTFNTIGYHDIVLSIIGTCPDDTTITVFVEEANAEFTSNPSYSCSEPMVVNFTPTYATAGDTYAWTFGNQETSTALNPSTTYVTEDQVYSINGAKPGWNIFTTTFNITTSSGCTASFTKTDTIHRPNALMHPDVVDGCVPVTVVFSDSSASNVDEPITTWEYVWGDGTPNLTVSTSAIQTHIYTIVGEFYAYLVVTNSTGCKDTSYLNPIKVGDVMTPDFTVDISTVCPGETVTFTDITPAPLGDSIDAWHYYTEANRMFHCFTDANPSWEYNNETGPQDVTLMVGFNGCFSSSTKTGFVTVEGAIAEIDFTCSCDEPFNVTFTDASHDATDLLWDFGDGNTSTLANSVHTYTVTGDYTVVLEATNSGTSCPISYDTTLIHIRELKAEFESDTFLCAGVNFPFEADTSQDVYENCFSGYTWSFSDPDMRPITTANSLEQIAFNTGGANTVTLVVADINGCTDTTSFEVQVYQIQPGFIIDSSVICLPWEVTFNDTSSLASDTTIVRWDWVFDDDSTLTFLTKDSLLVDTFTHGFAVPFVYPSVYNIVLTVTDTLGCVGTATKALTIYKPSSIITASDATICAGTTVDFTATDFTAQGSNLTFTWDFQNGDSSIFQNPSDSFLVAGSYPVKLVFVEISTGCKDSVTQTITVVDYPIANFTSDADGNAYICPNENVVFTNTTTTGGSADYNWDFGNGSTSTIVSPGTTFLTNGSYNVELIATIPNPYGCIDTIVRTFVVRGPTGNFTTDLGGGTICRLDSVLFTLIDTASVDNFMWDFGDGTSLSNVNPASHQYTFVPPLGTTVAKLVMSNSDGSCPVSESAIINIYQVIADFTRNSTDLDTAICFGTYTFINTSQNADQYYWDFGDGTTSSLQNPGTHDYPAAGTYDVTLGVYNTALTCTDTITKKIILHPIPDIMARGDTICESATGNLIAAGGTSNWSYIWTGPIAIINGTTATASSLPTDDTEYTIDVIDENGCVNSATATILVIKPTFLTDFDTIVPKGDSVFLPVIIDTAIFNVVWTPEEDLNCYNCSNPLIIPLEDHFYNLVMKDNFGCFSTEANYNVRVHPETFIILPTTFTPNGDGINDVIYVKGWGVKELIHYKIFNRWGELIFETNDIKVGWDGYYKGVLQNNDVYVYKVEARTWDEETQTLEGHINLMR